MRDDRTVATMLWNDELVVADRAKTLTAGDIRSYSVQHPTIYNSGAML